MNIKAVQAQAEFGIKFTIRLAGTGAFTLHVMHRSRLVVGSLLRREQERYPLVFCLPARGSARHF